MTRTARALVRCGLAFVTASAASGVEAQQIRGRVVDEWTRRPLVAVAITLFGPDSRVMDRAETDHDGFFRLRPGRPGEFTIEAELLGYFVDRRTVYVRGVDTTIAAFVLRSPVFALDSIEIRAERARRADPAVVGFPRASHVVAGERLALLEGQGITFLSAVLQLGGGLRVRQYRTPGGATRTCISSTRQIMSMQGSSCEWVAVIIDGIQIYDPEASLRSMHLDQFESVEYFTPVEAGYRFGMQASATGALVLWTRGRGPHADPARNRH